MKNYFKISTWLLLTLVLLISFNRCQAQHSKANPSLNAYLMAVDSAFIQNDSASFNNLVPLKEIQNYYASLVHEKMDRKAGSHRILRAYPDSAFVLITGMGRYGNSGDETNSALHYSGIYMLKKVAGNWQMQERIAFDRLNQITAQHIDLSVKPGEGMTINDSLTINTNDPLGFVARINHCARFTAILLDGKKVPFVFDGGLLWIASPVNQKQQLTLCYFLQVEHDEKNVNSGYFGDIYGHVRNQYCWHPFFNFASPNDRAEFVIHATIPKAYPLSTSLPQTDRIEGQLRIIEAHSENPTFALSLYYDKEWQVSRSQKAKTALVIYATPDFEPNRDTLYRYFSETNDVLRTNFGEARSTYLGIVQDRSGGGNGWKNRSNNTIIAAAKGSYLIVGSPRPRAIFGHEVAHGWTTPNGAAANFLSEGWATFCESYLLAAHYTDTIIKPFFKSQRANYINGGYDGKVSMNDDYSNGGVSYGKGAWLFYMLQNQLGYARFNTAMRAFVSSNNQDINNFVRLVSTAAGKDMDPQIRPWLENKRIPLLSVIKQDHRLVIRQENELFQFPLTVRLLLKNGSVIDKTIVINNREQSLSLPDSDLKSYLIDPDEQMLFQLKK